MSVSTGSDGRIACPSEASGFHGDFLRGKETALRFLPRHLSREADWAARVEEVASRPPAAAVWDRALGDGERLGADEASRDGARALRDGDALCVTTEQQPGLFLGPLYVIYKAMTAVALARRVEERTGRRTVPVYWNAADDSDFGEVGTAFLAGEDYRLARLSLSGADLPAGGMVGGLSVDGTRAALEEASDILRDRPSERTTREHLTRAMDRAADHGELTAALLHDLLRGTGVVVVDGRWDELRRAAGGIFAAYAEQREAVAAEVRSAGQALTEAGYRARISDASADHALFALRDGVRLPFPGDDAELARCAAEAPETLSPNVLLRPLVQDALFPNVATVGGPGEISYHAQLAGVYRRLGYGMPVLFPRFEATLVPPGVYALARRRGRDVAEFVRDFDGTMKATAAAALPAELRDALADLEARLREGGERVRDAAAAFDGKLSGAVDDARRRIDDALGRLHDKTSRAAKAAEAALDPALGAYREFLRPRGIPQERVLSALALFLESATHPRTCLEQVLDEHLDSASAGRPLHWLLPLHGCGGEDPA